jgi:hypothetical protein
MPLQAKSRPDRPSLAGPGPGRPYTRPRADSANRGDAVTADCPGPGGHSARPGACHVTGRRTASASHGAAGPAGAGPGPAASAPGRDPRRTVQVENLNFKLESQLD